MAKEIERKFLVNKALLPIDQADSKSRFEQAYICAMPAATVRLRIIDGREARLTVKGLNHGISRDEWEYEIPVEDARQMLDRLPVTAAIDKERLRFGRWEVDIFHGSLEGLAVAEIELTSADETVELPDFVGREVSGDPRYYNSSLASASSLPPTV